MPNLSIMFMQDSRISRASAHGKVWTFVNTWLFWSKREKYKETVTSHARTL